MCAAQHLLLPALASLTGAQVAVSLLVKPAFSSERSIFVRANGGRVDNTEVIV